MVRRAYGALFSFGSDDTFTAPLGRTPERMGAAISVDAKTRPQETWKTA